MEREVDDHDTNLDLNIHFISMYRVDINALKTYIFRF